MTLWAAHNEVTIPPMNTGEYEPRAAGIWRIQWVNDAMRRYESILTVGAKLEFHGAAGERDLRTQEGSA